MPGRDVSGWQWGALLAVPLMGSRRPRPTARGSTLAAALVALAMLAAPRAGAQSLDPPTVSQAIDLQRYKPGPGATDILGVHGARVGQGWHLGASLSYASNPLGFFDARQKDFVYQVVSSQLTLDLMGSVSYCERFELGVALPLTYQASARGVSALPSFAEGVTGAGLGDLRMVPKVRLVSTGRLYLGVAVPVLLPTAGGRAFRGGAGVAAQPQVLGEWASSGGVRLVANLGVHVRTEARLLTLRTGTEWLYA
ncbi:MAG TPA: cell envelope biogenesis protein OmpA, partial [Archangium sp.]